MMETMRSVYLVWLALAPLAAREQAELAIRDKPPQALRAADPSAPNARTVAVDIP